MLINVSVFIFYFKMTAQNRRLKDGLISKAGKEINPYPNRLLLLSLTSQAMQTAVCPIHRFGTENLLGGYDSKLDVILSQLLRPAQHGIWQSVNVLEG